VATTQGPPEDKGVEVGIMVRSQRLALKMLTVAARHPESEQFPFLKRFVFCLVTVSENKWD
jgi:hypothetical protein